MENTAVNNVNISLSEYNILKSNLDASRDLLAKATTELNILRTQQTENKLLVLEKKVYDPNYGQKTVSKLEINVKDPEVSKIILDTISQVETSELETKLKDKEDQIRNLSSSIKSYEIQLEDVLRNQTAEIRKMEDAKTEQIRKLKKGYEETILELETDKETLQKALKDLKVNKTQEQLEVARQEELEEKQKEIDALKEFKHQIGNFDTNTLKGIKGLRKFIADFDLARKFREDNRWVNNLWNRSLTAVERLQAFASVIKGVGALPEKKQKAYAQPEPQAYYNNGYYYGTTATRW